MSDAQAWDLYFASLMAFTIHPGYFKTPELLPSVQDMAKRADEMLVERRERWQP